MVPLALFVLLVFVFSLVSKRLEGTIVTAPIVFTVAGMLMFFLLPWIQRAGFNATVFLRLAEFSLVLLLFTDASRTELNILRGLGSLPARLLSVGLLLTIAAGAVVARPEKVGGKELGDRIAQCAQPKSSR
jgi:NhaP-type Na+/H+ or K+/H+ antiporter